MRPCYAHDDHWKWIEERLRYADRSTVISPLGKEVANVLGYVGNGIYNAPIKPLKTNWSDKYCIEVNWRGGLATYDSPGLTWLVLECHRRMLRVEIEPCNFNLMRLCFWQRQRTGSGAERMPDIQEMIQINESNWARVKNDNE